VDARDGTWLGIASYESLAPSQSHAISRKSRSGPVFAPGWHYQKPKTGFTREKKFPNSTFFRAQQYFDVKTFWLVSRDEKKFPNGPWHCWPATVDRCWCLSRLYVESKLNWAHLRAQHIDYLSTRKKFIPPSRLNYTFLGGTLPSTSTLVPFTGHVLLLEIYWQWPQLLLYCGCCRRFRRFFWWSDSEAWLFGRKSGPGPSMC